MVQSARNKTFPRFQISGRFVGIFFHVSIPVKFGIFGGFYKFLIRPFDKLPLCLGYNRW